MPDNRQSQNRSNAIASSSSPPSQNLEEAVRRLNIQDNQEGGDANRNHYPDRPGEPDCTYYMRTGMCGYGSSCRYNHPTYAGQGIQYGVELPERDGQPDCQYFLKTGTCKFGTTCKYHHPRDRLPAIHVPLNVLGLPMRQEEKSCPYYMRTGSCKFGFACKFHHPEPALGAVLPETRSSVYGPSGSAVASPSGIPFIGGNSSWTLPRPPYVSTPHMHGLPGFMPVVVPSSQSVIPAQHGWSTYTGTMNPVSSTEAVGVNHMSNSKPQIQSSSSTQVIFPERPGQPDCLYYIRTGSCRYGPACKYHHPKEKIAQVPTSTIGPHMLPLRPGQAVCTFYSTYGSCKYGSACKFDHPYPWAGYYGYTYPTFSMWDPSTLFPYQRSSSVNWTSSSTSAPETLKVADGFTKSEPKSNVKHMDVNMAEDQPPQAISPSQTAPSSGSTHDQSD
uniref:Zinc finger CCCH domain-containing protein 3 n=1 Tax=Anthurium amnicola TaxID=1678845 RepID=A0A1D1XMR0_9ARAE